MLLLVCANRVGDKKHIFDTFQVYFGNGCIDIRKSLPERLTLTAVSLSSSSPLPMHPAPPNPARRITLAKSLTILTTRVQRPN